MDAEDIAVAIRDGLDLIIDNTEIAEVVDDFNNLWITTEDGQTFMVKVTRIEDT